MEGIHAGEERQLSKVMLYIEACTVAHYKYVQAKALHMQ